MKVAVLKMTDVRPNPVALRAVDRESDEYQELRDSIKQMGIIDPISVRARANPDTSIYYEIVNGLHRYSAAVDLGMVEIPAQVLDLDENQVLEAQIMANIHKVETLPVQYSKQLLRLLTANPTWTASELSVRLAKNPGWVSERLGLLRLDPEIQKMVDSNQVNLTNAIQLAKLPKEDQPKFLQMSIDTAQPEFLAAVALRLKEIRKARNQGKEAGPVQFMPTPHLRKLAEIKAEQEAPNTLKSLISEMGITDPVTAAQFAISWVLNLDPHAVAGAKAKFEARVKALEDAKAARKAEREKKKAEEAAKAAAKV